MLYLNVSIGMELTYTGKKYLVKRMLRVYSRGESIREAMEHNIDALRASR